MQVCECLVLIGGDQRNSVHKSAVTPAELVILQRIHGLDAVRDIFVRRMDRRTHDEERDRLGAFYGDEVVSQVFGSYGKLPSTVKEAKIMPDMIVDAPVRGAEVPDIPLGESDEESAAEPTE